MTQVYFRGSNPKEGLGRSLRRRGRPFRRGARSRRLYRAIPHHGAASKLGAAGSCTSAPTVTGATGSRCSDQDHRDALQYRLSMKLSRADGHYFGLR